jgi:hypothetical protein
MNPGFQPEWAMKRAILVALGTGAVITSAAAIGIGATLASSPGASMSRAEYEAALRGIAASRERVLEECQALAGHERELCRTEVAANELVSVAQIESAYRRSEPAARALQRARIESRYQIDRARCGAHGGIKRDRCLIQAHATKGRAMLETAAPYEARYRQ